MASTREVGIKGAPGVDEGISPLDINACVTEMARITRIPLRVVAVDGGYAIEDTSGAHSRVENVAFRDDQLIMGGKILALRADPAGEGMFLIYFQQLLGSKIVRSTGLRSCWQGGRWRADFASDAGSNRMEVSRDDLGTPVIPLAVAESEDGFTLASPEGLFGPRTLEIMPEPGGRFSARLRSNAVLEFPPTFRLTREFWDRGKNLGWNQSRIVVTQENGRVSVQLHCGLPRQDGNKDIDISIAVAKGDLETANLLTLALFEPAKLVAMVSAKGL